MSMREDRWSARFPVAAGIVALAFWFAALKASLLIGVLSFVAAAVVGVVGSITGLARLVGGRWRGAACALSAPLTVTIGIAAAPIAVEQAQSLDFAIHRTEYEEAVKSWKAEGQGPSPFRLVVDGVDRSVFLTNIFDDIVYDESDAVGRDPDAFSGVWPCAIPGWKSRIMVVGGGRKSVKPLGDHFYLVDQVD